jgi:hypothetical protein
MYKKNLIIKSLLMVILLFASLFVINASSIPITDGGGTTPCSSLGQTDCLARTDCCWSDHWQICRGTGESCCHDIACSRGDPLCYQCANDALNCYVCQGGNVWSDTCAGKYPDCQGKLIGDYCQSAPNKRCDSSCNCAVQPCVESMESASYAGATLYCSLPGSVCQQGDTIQGIMEVNTLPCPTTPVIQVSITGSGCSITDSFSAGRYYASGPGWWYEYSWTFPQIPTGCLGKTVTLTLTSQGKSTSKTIKLSSDPTRDNPPSLPNVGVWSPTTIIPSDKITYTAHAEDDKGLSQIQILLFANYQYTVVKTCSVSGTSADCTYTTPTSFSAGSEICMIGNALDIKNQQNSGYDMGARKDRNCVGVCDFPIDTDNAKNYYVKGNCTSSCGRTASDGCIWEGPRGYCCNTLPAPSDITLYWSPQNILEDGTVTCCLMQGKFGSCIDTKTVNCKNILMEGYIEGKECKFEYYDCSGEGKICQSGKCVSGSSVCTYTNPTVTISPSSQTGSLGQSLTYIANIKNNDNSACSASTFTLTNTCPSGWTCSLNKNSVVISPGITDSSTTTVTSPSSATSGTYSFSVTATSNSYTGTGSANYVIGGIANQCSDGTAYGQCSSNKPKYCDNGNLVDRCSSKSCGCPTGQNCNTTSDTCYTPSGNIQINLKPGWNMFSVPVNTNLNVNDIKTQCGTTNPVWHYNPSSSLYESATQVQPGYGYWLKVSNNCYIQVSGNNIESLPELKAGWNQVGALSQSVNFNDVKGNCNVLGGPWKYNPVTLRYELASILDPGYGYWVRVSSNCNLNIGGSPPPTP